MRTTKKRNRISFYINNPDYNKNYHKEKHVPIPTILRKCRSSKTKQTPDEVRTYDRLRYHLKKLNKDQISQSFF